MWWLGVACLLVLVAVPGCVSVRTSALARQVRKLHGESWRLLGRGDQSGAMAVLAELDRLAPGNPQVLERWSSCLVAAGRGEEALVVLRRAAECGSLACAGEASEPDFAGIWDDPRMAEVRRIAQANMERFLAAGDDPYAAVSAAGCPDASSVRAIVRYYGRQRRRLCESGRWLGPWPVYEEDQRQTRGKIDALRAWIEAHPGDARVPEAYLAMVESYGVLHRAVGFSGPVSRATAERMRRVVDEFAAGRPEDRLLPAARYLLLTADWEVAARGLSADSGMSTEAGRETVHRFARSFMELADGDADRRTEGLALCRALGLGYAEDEPQVRARVVERLRACMRRDRQVHREAWRHARLPLLQELGTPEFEATDTAGRRHRLGDYRGRLLVLDFWGSWCGPCVGELPEMRKLYAQYVGKGVELLGVALEEARNVPRERFVAWCENEGIVWPQVYGGKGWKHPMARLFHVQAVPQLIFIDANGCVAGEGRAKAAELWIRRELGLADEPLPAARSGR